MLTLDKSSVWAEATTAVCVEATSPGWGRSHDPSDQEQDQVLDQEGTSLNWTWICGGRRHRPLGIQDIEWAAEWVSASQHEPSMFSRDPLAHEGEAMILVQTRHNTLGKPIDTQLWRQGQSDAPRLQPRAVAATAPDNLIGRNHLAIDT